MTLAEVGARQLRLAETGKYRILLAGIMRLAARWNVPGRASALDAGALDNAYLLLAQIEMRDPRVVAGLIESPQFGAWANDALHRLLVFSDADDVRTLEDDLGRLALFAASAAVRTAQPFDVEVPLRDGAASFPTLGTLSLDGATGRRWARVRQDSTACYAQSGTVTARLPGSLAQTRCWTPLPRVTVREHGLLLDVLLDSQDPFLDRYDVPRLHVSSPELDRWRNLLTAGWEILAGGHPELAVQVAETVRTVVPLASPVAGHQAGATEETSFGAIALALPADGLAMAEALVHESHHAILGALTDLEPLISLDASGFLGHAPWRADPRPPHALLHGIYAHHAMGRFWRREYRTGPHAGHPQAALQFGKIREMLADAIPTLINSGQLTEAGLELLTPIVEDVAEWQAESLGVLGQ
jgi:HEXXH motif-containing protein